MEGYRARDADRDRYVDLIEAAYVDGQLGAEDRELRVSRALAAETIAELETLTRDLQRDALPAPAPVVPRRRGRTVAALAAAAAGVVVLAGAGLLLASPSQPETVWPTIEAEVAEQPAPPPPAQSAAPDVEPFEMTPAQVRRFLDSHEEEFGTLDTFEAGFYPTRVGVQVPVRGSRARMERWSYDGAWTQDTEARRVVGAEGTIDLARLDVGRLFANIRRAERTLAVQGGRLTHVLVDTWTDGTPTVNIHVGNEYDETGYLKTTLAGDVVRAFPYDG